MSVLRVAGAQLPNVVGDLDGNCRSILDAMTWAEDQHADVLLLPELALTGYPLEDLALRGEFLGAASDALDRLARESGRTTTVVGTVDEVPPRKSWDTRPRDVANGAALLADGGIRGVYHKTLLPTYEVFDEARNFAAGSDPGAVWRIGGTVAGVCVCEDLWSDDGPPEAQAAAGAQVLLVLNGSPFHREKPKGRLALVSSVARRNGVPLVYVNCVGAQDELVFDGGSLIVDATGALVYRAEQFTVDRFCVDVETAPPRPVSPAVRTVHARAELDRAAAPPPASAPLMPEIEQVWCALVVGTRDFAQKNGADAGVLGLSGGIDSAVTAAIAAEALEPENVLGVAMPAPGSPPRDLTDAEALARNLGIGFEVVEMDALMAAVAAGLAPVIEGRPTSEVRHDLLARMRGATLQAIADELGHLALATGNKTELSLGSTALYGDMAGGFAPVKDCPKTLLYSLARLRNRDGEVIPEGILAKLPSALMGEDVGLPAYEELDPIVERYVERGQVLEDIVEAGFDPTVVRGVLQLIDDAEPLRRLIPPGPKISQRAFGKDRRMPITNAWRPFHGEEVKLAPSPEAAAPQDRGESTITHTGRAQDRGS
jgi:NAD+ synthase (glutamine-hydrolysing)